MVEMLHIEPNDLLLESFRLGKMVHETGFRPKHAISIWRGGTPIGLGVDGYFRMQGVRFHHTSIATTSYRGIGEQGDVVVKGLEHVIQSVCREDGLLIIDDVYESGRTIETIVRTIRERARRNAPRDIRVATIHRKERAHVYTELPILSLHDVAEDVWIDYPHELADLVGPDDPEEARLRNKAKTIPLIHDILHADGFPQEEVEIPDGKTYLRPRDLLLDAMRLGVNIARTGYRPDFLIATWPGGVNAGLCIHEVFKYFNKTRGEADTRTDHIPINTTQTHLSYRSDIVGLDYLIERVAYEHEILIVDTTHRSGRQTSDIVNSLKEGLRRNLDLGKIKVASVYWNPDDKCTWTVRPFKYAPDFYLKKVTQNLVYPHAVHRMKNPRRELRTANPKLHELLFACET